jgi:hypothetical protein
MLDIGVRVLAQNYGILIDVWLRFIPGKSRYQSSIFLTLAVDSRITLDFLTHRLLDSLNLVCYDVG